MSALGAVLLLLLLLLLAIAGKIAVIASPVKGNESPQKPHFILIVADDLGWYDVPWNNPKAMSPNLEKLARTGVILDQSYVQQLCTPTRAALLTGKYPFTIGRQHHAILPKQPAGLSIKRQILPQAMKAAGYSTHIVGKWHLGFCSWDYVPTSRGFDTFFGYYNGAEDYYEHIRPASGNGILDNEKGNLMKFGYDFRNNTTVEESVVGRYSTEIFSSYIKNLLTSRDSSQPMFLYLPFQSVHGPLQVPEKFKKPFAYVRDADRKTKLGMILAMDDAVGEIINALKNSAHYNNSIIIFTTDNGASTPKAGNNWPLRGSKATLWEGGTRGPAFVHSPLLSKKGVVSDKLIHVTDWFSTIVGLAGGEAPKDTDGYDQWKAITTSAPSPRFEMVYNIDVTENIRAGVRRGDYKLLLGNQGFDDWVYPPENNMGLLKKSSHLQNEDHPSYPLKKVNLQRKPKNGLYSIMSDAVDDLSIGGDSQNETEDAEEDAEDLRSSQVTKGESDLVAFSELGLDIIRYSLLKGHLTNDTEIGLFHIKDDPEERKNLALEKPKEVNVILNYLQDCMKDYVEADFPAKNTAGNPKYWNNVWSPGWCIAK